MKKLLVATVLAVPTAIAAVTIVPNGAASTLHPRATRDIQEGDLKVKHHDGVKNEDGDREASDEDKDALLVNLYLLGLHCPQFQDQISEIMNAIMNGELSLGYLSPYSDKKAVADGNTILIKEENYDLPRGDLAGLGLHESYHVTDGRAYVNPDPDYQGEGKERWNIQAPITPEEHHAIAIDVLEAMCCLKEAGAIDEVPEEREQEEEWLREQSNDYHGSKNEQDPSHEVPELEPAPEC